MSSDTRGPVIVWQNYGCEGWQPTSFPTLKEALLAQRYQSEFIITRTVAFETQEIGNAVGYTESANVV